MKKSRLPLKYDGLSARLLTVTLFLGIFAFSGQISNTLSREKEARTTELVVSIKAHSNRAASYVRAFALFHQGNRRAFSDSEFDLLTCFHNRLAKTQIEQNSSYVSSRRKPARFFQRKTLPQNSDEDIFISVRG